MEDKDRNPPDREPTAKPEDQPTLDHVPSPAPGGLAARYDILSELGRGGMGIVYKARDRETGAVVALKVLRPEIAADVQVMERFKAELLLARRITHKNVCRVYDLNRFGNVAAISMEYIEGESLRSLLKREQGFAIRYGLRILGQVMAGLKEAHAQGVVHRDLKPENILIAQDGTVKVMDFGIARSAEGGATLTGSLVGTPAYMSPEQAEGKTADARSDLYSLGLVMYEMFAGQQAFRGDTPLSVALKQVQETPPPPRQFEPDLPERIERAIRQCLEKNPARRFQSVEELEAALSEERPPEPSAESEPVPAPHLSRWGRADSILLVLGILGLFYFLAWRNSVFPGSKFVLEVDEVTARRAAQDLVQGLGYHFPGEVRTELEYQPQEHILASMAATYGWGGDLPQVRFPLHWKTSFFEARGLEIREVSLIRLAATETPVMVPEGYVRLDGQGKLLEVVFTEPLVRVPASYRPPSNEERRVLARKVVEEACGPVSARWILAETSGGDLGASYSATWKWLRGAGSRVWAEVSLLQEKVTRLKCSAREWEPVALPPAMLKWVGLLIFWALARLLMLFATGQCHRSPIFWKRLHWAVLLGVAGGWVVLPSFFASPPSLPVRLAAGLASSGLFLVGLVAVEHHLRRRAPAGIASYALALRGRFQDPAVALAVVRGALAGLVLTALETLLAHLAMGLRAPLIHGRPSLAHFSALLDPTPVGHALASFSPALFVVSSAFFHGFLLGLILLGLGWVQSFAALRKAKKWKTLQAFMNIPVYVFLGIVGLPLHVGVFEGMLWGFFIYSAIWAIALGWVLVRYDLLTAAVAVATATLWALNYPLLHILREVGNGAHWGIFAGWAALIVLAALVAFQARLRLYLRQE